MRKWHIVCEMFVAVGHRTPSCGGDVYVALRAADCRRLFGDMGVIIVEIGDVLCLLSSEVN